jgi:hypothetical protein
MVQQRKSQASMMGIAGENHDHIHGPYEERKEKTKKKQKKRKKTGTSNRKNTVTGTHVMRMATKKARRSGPDKARPWQ